MDPLTLRGCRVDVAQGRAIEGGMGPIRLEGCTIAGDIWKWMGTLTLIDTIVRGDVRIGDDLHLSRSHIQGALVVTNQNCRVEAGNRVDVVRMESVPALQTLPTSAVAKVWQVVLEAGADVGRIDFRSGIGRIVCRRGAVFHGPRQPGVEFVDLSATCSGLGGVAGTLCGALASGEALPESLTDETDVSPQAWQGRTAILAELLRQHRDSHPEDEAAVRVRDHVCALGSVLKEALEGPKAPTCEAWLNACHDGPRTDWVAALVLATMQDPFFDGEAAPRPRWLSACAAAAPLADEVMTVVGALSPTLSELFQASPFRLPMATLSAVRALIGGGLGNAA